MTDPSISAHDGRCTLCEKQGPIGYLCDTDVCTKRGHHYIPAAFARAAATDSFGGEMILGRLIEDFLLVKLLGKGGFGQVFLALQLPVMLKAALKLLIPRSLEVADQESQRRLLTEAQSLARLHHPNIVRLYKYGIYMNRPYMAMEYVDGGRTLASELKSRRNGFSDELSEHIIGQLLDGLRAAHENNIVHRDLSPHNVMLQEVPRDPYFARILDFGLARITDQPSRTANIVGTPQFMAPEQLTAGQIGPFTDLYALGALTALLWTGEPPISGGREAVLSKKTRPERDPVGELSGLLSTNRAAFLRKAIAYNPADRYHDAESFRAAFREAMDLGGAVELPQRPLQALTPPSSDSGTPPRPGENPSPGATQGAGDVTESAYLDGFEKQQPAPGRSLKLLYALLTLLLVAGAGYLLRERLFGISESTTADRLLSIEANSKTLPRPGKRSGGKNSPALIREHPPVKVPLLKVNPDRDSKTVPLPGPSVALRFHDSPFTIGRDLAQLTDRDLLIVGHSQKDPRGPTNVWSARVSERGKRRARPGEQATGHTAVVLAPSPGVTITGGIRTGKGRWQKALVAWDGSNGWQQLFGRDQLHSRIGGIAPVYNGTLIIGGTQARPSTGWLFGVTRKGSLSWSKRLRMRYGVSEITDVIASPDALFVTIGRLEELGGKRPGVWIAKLDLDGNFRWIKSIRLKWDTRANAVAVLQNGTLFVTGYQKQNQNAPKSAWVAVLDHRGRVLRTATYPANGGSSGSALARVGKQTVLVGAVNGSDTLRLMLIDQSCRRRWERTFRSRSIVLQTLLVARSKSLLVLGHHASPRGRETFLLKLDRLGNPLRW